MSALLPLGLWVPILDGDPVAAAAYLEHYSSLRSRQRRLDRGTLLTVGPGQKLILSTPCRRAHFAWRKFIDDTGQDGICCAWFNNRGAGLSSLLIAAADCIADAKWPGERHYTLVNPALINSSNPGFCFKMAGWNLCGSTKGGLLVLDRLPISLARAA